MSPFFPSMGENRGRHDKTLSVAPSRWGLHDLVGVRKGRMLPSCQLRSRGRQYGSFQVGIPLGACMLAHERVVGDLRRDVQFMEVPTHPGRACVISSQKHTETRIWILLVL